MKNYDELEEEAIAISAKKRSKMKISGKSVFLLSRESLKPNKKAKK